MSEWSEIQLAYVNVKSYVQLKNGCGVFLGHHMAWRPHEFLIDPEEGKLSLSFFFSCMSFFLFHILLLCLFCSSLIFLPNYDGPGWTQTDLNQPKRSWTSSESDHLITLCNLMAAISEKGEGHSTLVGFLSMKTHSTSI